MAKDFMKEHNQNNGGHFSSNNGGQFSTNNGGQFSSPNKGGQFAPESKKQNNVKQKLNNMGFGPKNNASPAPAINKEKSQKLAGSKIEPGNPFGAEGSPVGITKHKLESNRGANKRLNKMFDETNAATLGVWNNKDKKNILAKPEQVKFNPKLDKSKEVNEKLGNMGFGPKINQPKEREYDHEIVRDMAYSLGFDGGRKTKMGSDDYAKGFIGEGKLTQDEYDELYDLYAREAPKYHVGYNYEAKPLTKQEHVRRKELENKAINGYNKEIDDVFDIKGNNMRDFAPFDEDKDIQKAYEHVVDINKNKGIEGKLTVKDVLEDLPEVFENNPELTKKVEDVVKKHNKPYEINEQINGRPLLQGGGTPLYPFYENGKLIAGTMTNSGPMSDYEIDWDDDKSLDENLQALQDEIDSYYEADEVFNEVEDDERTRNYVLRNMKEWMNEADNGPIDEDLMMKAFHKVDKEYDIDNMMSADEVWETVANEYDELKDGENNADDPESLDYEIEDVETQLMDLENHAPYGLTINEQQHQKELEEKLRDLKARRESLENVKKN